MCPGYVEFFHTNCGEQQVGKGQNEDNSNNYHIVTSNKYTGVNDNPCSFAAGNNLKDR